MYALGIVVACTVALSLSGCASSNWVKVRRNPGVPVAQPLRLFSPRGPQPTFRTVQLLRRYDLLDETEAEPQRSLAKVQQIVAAEPTADNVYAFAELAYVAGKKAEAQGSEDIALDMYGAAVAHAYFFLLSDTFDGARNPYDPQFRLACDVYNGSLESAMRIIQRRGQLKPGSTYTVRTATQQFDVSVVVRGAWEAEDFERVEFVSDYELEGLTNHYHTYGLGVPLIAVYRNRQGNHPATRFYPPGLSFPVTAFLRVLPDRHTVGPDGRRRHHCVLEFHDSLLSSDIRVDNRLVPLETDLSTPLAHTLNNPLFRETDIATRGLLDPRDSQHASGLYMLEPYDPYKTPVIMVHGFWSSLMTWMEMFNDLRGTRMIRDHYQFWFYQYPTGQPLWTTAADLRQQLALARKTLDPHHRDPALDRMVLVGHSMGGLVSKLQTLDSGDDFWKIVSDQPFDQLKASLETRQELRQTFFFQPNPSIRRVVMIAAPHRGSRFSNGATQWLGRRVIDLPEMVADNVQDMFATSQRQVEREPSKFRQIKTSIDSLAPESPLLPVMLETRPPAWVKYHNIVALLPETGIIGKMARGSDGVLDFSSAHLDDVESELVVGAHHVNVHRQPRTVLEVRRILLEHLAEMNRGGIYRLPPDKTASTAPAGPSR